MINVVTRQGSDRFLDHASYYGQPAGVTSQPVTLTYPGLAQRKSGYERVNDHDATTNIRGGPVVARSPLVFCRLSVLTRLRQPARHGSRNSPGPTSRTRCSPSSTWRLTPSLQMLQSFHYEHWVNPELPTSVKPFETTATAPRCSPGGDLCTCHPHPVIKHRLGRASGTVRLQPGRRPEHGKPDYSQPAGSSDRRAQGGGFLQSSAASRSFGRRARQP